MIVGVLSSKAHQHSRKEPSPERVCLIISPPQLTAAFSEPADTKQCRTDKHGSRAKLPTLAGFSLNALLFIVEELHIYCTSVTVAKLVPRFFALTTGGINAFMP